MEQKKMDRISELSRKSKTEGLTDAEKAEQAQLRQEYINDIKRNMRAMLGDPKDFNNNIKH